MDLNKECELIKIDKLNTLLNGTVSNYVNYFWIVKNDSILVNKRFKNFLCNQNKQIVELLIKNEGFEGCSVVQIPLICSTESLIDRLINK